MAGDDAASLRRIEGIVGGSDAITIRRIGGEWWDFFEDDGGAVLANVGLLDPGAIVFTSICAPNKERDTTDRGDRVEDLVGAVALQGEG